MSDFRFALVLATLMDWFAFICQRKLRANTQGEYAALILPLFGIAATIGHFIFFDGFCIALFFKSGFKWYQPILIWAIAFAINLFVLDRIYGFISAKASALVEIINLAAFFGIFLIAYHQIRFLIF